MMDVTLPSGPTVIETSCDEYVAAKAVADVDTSVMSAVRRNEREQQCIERLLRAPLNFDGARHRRLAQAVLSRFSDRDPGGRFSTPS
jgi:hypothetical protein